MPAEDAATPSKALLARGSPFPRQPRFLWEATHWCTLYAVGRATSHVEPGWTMRVSDQDCNFPTARTLGREEMGVLVALAPSESPG